MQIPQQIESISIGCAANAYGTHLRHVAAA